MDSANSAPPQTQQTIAALFFGMAGELSGKPLDALIRAGIEVRAVIMPAFDTMRASAPYLVRPSTGARVSRRGLPMLGATPRMATAEIAAAHGIPVLEVARLRHPLTLAALEAFTPDVICVSCFSRRIPAEVLKIPRLGAINLHPSLLPDNRGPDPLFWTFWRGDAETGVTIHLMDEGLDTGPILRQERFPLPDGTTEGELLARCASVGAVALAGSVRDLAEGRVTPLPQDPARATAYSWPAAEDYIITPDRPARWAYNFSRGVMGRGEPVTARVDDTVFRILELVAYQPDQRLATGWSYEDNVLSLQCTPGVFIAQAIEERV